MEIWKDIQGFEGLYMVSSIGNIKSLARLKNNGRRGTIMTQEFIMKKRLRDSYQILNLRKDKILSTVLIHRLVAIAFIPNPENKPCINHLNGIKTDNRVENLEWSTVSENTQHAYDMGLIPSRCGNNNPNSIFKKQLKTSA
jgi:hypothetical protein